MAAGPSMNQIVQVGGQALECERIALDPLFQCSRTNTALARARAVFSFVRFAPYASDEDRLVELRSLDKPSDIRVSSPVPN